MTEYNELRCYTFTLYQLSPIQQGIQAGHAAIELGMKCSRERGEDPQAWQTYCHWAETWSTMVLLNGGNSAELNEVYNLLDSDDCNLPWASFRESEDSLNGIMTSIAVIVPARVFNMANDLRKKVDCWGVFLESYTSWEQAFIILLADKGLAR
jgi:hypothetical protein